ncbi:MAG: alpha-L-fucosidase [Anditalea sp.]
MRKCIVLLIFSGILSEISAQESNNQVLPTEAQIKWADAEIGVMYHLDMQVFEPSYNFRNDFDYTPDISIFNPRELNTDQWIQAAKSAGATYAILVAKHNSGFSLWPTKAHGYSVKNTPWRDGEADIVRDFIASCKKYGIKPGIYASVAGNGYFKVENPGLVLSGDPKEQEAYKEVVRTQLTELWTQYGELFEIWFDGGVLPPEKGGIDMLALIQKYQPNAIAFQGPYGYQNNIRWVGNEKGVAPYPNWARADSTTSATGVIQIKGLHGNPQGEFWCPGEADFALREKAFQGGWFWKEGEDDRIRSLEDLRTRFDETVGRNSNMVLGIVVNDEGLVPEADVKRLAEFGEDVKKRFSNSLGSTSGEKDLFTIAFSSPEPVKYIVIQEEISKGERILEYRLAGKKNGVWRHLDEGISIGHKRIHPIDDGLFSSIRLEIIKSEGKPSIRNLEVF